MGQGSGIAMSCGVGLDVGRRRGLDPVLLWLWHRLEATAAIRCLSWEPPCAVGAALKKSKRQKKIKRNPTLHGYEPVSKACGLFVC